MAVLPSETADIAEAHQGDQPPSTTVPMSFQNDEPIVWIQPSATGGAILRPQEALLSSFQHNARHDRVLELTPMDVRRWTKAARALHDICGDLPNPTELLDAIPSDVRDSLSRGGEMSESLRRFQTVITSLVESTSVLYH